MVSSRGRTNATPRRKDHESRQAEEVDGHGEDADRDGGHADQRGCGRAVPSRGYQPDTVLRMEEATAVLGKQGIRRSAAETVRHRGSQGGEDPAPGESDCGDHVGEPGAKKRALGLEDHSQMPPELQRQVHATVEQTRRRSGWSTKRTLVALGIARRTYYRWLKEEGEAVAGGAGSAGAALRGIDRGEASGPGVCASARGVAAPGVGLADGG